ncbi:hypothetical protein ACL2XK_10825 [Sodalis sp. RH23]|uniref:hypothetical protein n=1 Tax=unclassified Sodalis (in: enterobacteria) TaxID=2636512 RepID=UPI0039B623AA
MSNMKLNFIIPVRHYLSVKDWDSVKSNLVDTIHSINGQSSSNWHCYIVANEGTDLPEVNEKFTIINVRFPLNNLPDKTRDIQLFYDKVREDKGLRVYEAVKHCNKNTFFMVVDYDDYVNSSITDFVVKDADKPGWFISMGYLYSGGGYLLKHNKFDEVCGTSNIVKVSFLDRYTSQDGQLPLDKIKELLGSHRFIKKYMNAEGYDYKALPFPGAIYNIGISSSTSQTPSIIRRVFSPKNIIKKPFDFINNIFNLRLIDEKIIRSFNFNKSKNTY